MEKEYGSAIFMQLILGLQNSAWITLGKIQNPMTGKLDRNLEQAKVTIDTIEMLKEKTKGNLSSDESNLIENILGQLHLNYIDEAKKGDSKTTDQEESPAESGNRGSDAYVDGSGKTEEEPTKTTLSESVPDDKSYHDPVVSD